MNLRSAVFATGLISFISGVVSATRADPVDDKAAMCAACHGQAGIPVSKEIPVIWGQQEGYLYLQLRDFKSGARANEIKSSMVANLSRDDMLALAAYFASKPWPDLGQPRASGADATRAQTARASVGCPACHSDRFQGDGTVPRVAGQSAAYLAKTLSDFRTGARANNPGMSSFVRAISEADLAALEKYLAGL